MMNGRDTFIMVLAESMICWQVTIKFQIPPTCDIPLIIADLVLRLGAKIDDGASNSDMILQAWNRFLDNSIILVNLFQF